MISRNARLLVIGPVPPPTNGQSVVTNHLISKLGPDFPNLTVTDIGDGNITNWRRPLSNLRKSAMALLSIPGSDSVYIAVKASHGMWLSTAAAGLARLTGAQVILHHHSYAYVRQRETRMVALTRAAGPNAVHIALSKSMAADLRAIMPEIIRKPLVLNNAGLIDTSLVNLAPKGDAGSPVLGHLSNLTSEKGISEVVTLAIALRAAGSPVRLIVGGPATDDHARVQLARASSELGDLFEYRGPLSGDAKRKFFGDITHFIFPSRYSHEAAPLVLYEAMAAGVVCIATRQGSISEQLEGSPGLLAESPDALVTEALPIIASASPSSAASQSTRKVFERAHLESQEQMVYLKAVLGYKRSRRRALRVRRWWSLLRPTVHF